MSTKGKDFELQGNVWMTVGGENFGGRGRVALLAEIANCGSITQAAKAMKMSYKAAWDAIDTMSNVAGEPLVERLAGGKGGGGTRLTPRGQQLVANFRHIDRVHRLFIEMLNSQSTELADDFQLIKRLNMRTSARNQFSGKVTALKTGAVNDEVELEIVGGQKLVAIVTHESVESLGLRIGTEAYALVKASSVIVMTEADDVRLSARNRLSGKISRLIPGAVNTEVVIEVPGGGQVASIITNESSKALKLAEGGAATALFKASSVIVGVPA